VVWGLTPHKIHSLVGCSSVIEIYRQSGFSAPLYFFALRPPELMENLLNYPWAFGFLLACISALSLELGRRVGVSSQILQHSERKEQMVAIRDGLFVLLSLLLGFSLTLAAARFVERRSLLIEESISIGTAYLRAGTLPQPYREHSRNLFQQYVDARLDLDNAGLDTARAVQASNRSKSIYEELWTDAAAVAERKPTPITAAYINSLNETIDLHEKRIAAYENRVPLIIWTLIICVSMIAVFARGLTLTSRFWLNLVLAPVTIAIVVPLIADLDSPSRGFIRLDQRAMQRLKADLTAQSAH